MKISQKLAMAVLLLGLLALLLPLPVAQADGVVVFPDSNLEAAIRGAINKPAGDILQSDLDALTDLDGSSRGVIDLTGLEFCTGLEWLNLDYNQINDISQLSRLTNLDELWLSNNQISDISPLSGLTNLTDLDLGYNQISDISALSRLTNLEYLYLDGNLISDISALSGLTSLEYLQLVDNRISDISALSGLTSLEALYLTINRISDISPLSGLTNLTSLGLSSNQISDISPLSGLTSLKDLILNYNPLSDISPLIDNSGLGTGCTLDLEGTTLNSDSVNIYIPQLEQRGVEVTWSLAAATPTPAAIATPTPGLTPAPTVQPTSTSQATPAPATQPGEPFTFNIDDPPGDVSHGFIDIIQGSVTVDASSIVVKIKLADIPSQLLFANDDLSAPSTDYVWDLYIDVDNNALTGAPALGNYSYATGCEYSIGLKSYKSEGESQHYDSLIGGTLHYTWYYNSSSNTWVGTDLIQAEVDYSTMTITMTAPRDNAVSNSSKFYFVTYYDPGASIESREGDRAPDAPTPNALPPAEDTFVGSVALPSELSTDPAVIGTNIGLAIATVLIFYFAATLFNNTVKENYDVIQGWLRRVSARLRFRKASTSKATGDSKVAAKPKLRLYLEGALVVIICALIYIFLDPYSYLKDGLRGVALFISLVAGIGMATLSYEGVQVLVSARRFRVPAAIRIFPIAVLVAIVCVAFSKAIHFHPGVIYGFVGAYAALSISKLDEKKEALGVLLGTFVVVAISVSAFFLRELLVNQWAGESFGRMLVEDILVAAIAIGLEGLVFSLAIPVRFMDGYKLKSWNFWVALIVAVGVVFIFYWIIINNDGKLQDAAKDMKTIMMYILMGISLLISGSAWLYFLLRTKRLGGAAAEGQQSPLPEKDPKAD